MVRLIYKSTSGQLVYCTKSPLPIILKWYYSFKQIKTIKNKYSVPIEIIAS